MKVPPKTARTSAVGGIGIGVAIVAIAQHLPANLDWLRDCLIYVSPALSVGASFVWNRILWWWSFKQLLGRHEQAKKLRLAVWNDPDVPRSAKADFMKAEVQLGLLLMGTIVMSGEELSYDLGALKVPLSPPST